MKHRGIVQAVCMSSTGEQVQSQKGRDRGKLHNATFPGRSLNRTCGTRST
ncbi:hypothetical protein LMG23994_00801 [Cupriavidus pinatubonensis]|uniref:Uncharacterized protein n=1 Tax=Cupriavidus pinatubonensis TaxID=248026 RepID=A0ABM8WEK5_9BURK|nr:hypothetical protein LMG23994_00801 [Cupriavidus pinatubonensis]